MLISQGLLMEGFQRLKVKKQLSDTENNSYWTNQKKNTVVYQLTSKTYFFGFK